MYKTDFKKINIRWQLFLYDTIIFCISVLITFLFNDISQFYKWTSCLILSYIIIFIGRIIGKVYKQIWRYGGIESYIRLILVDSISFVMQYILIRILIKSYVSFFIILAFSILNLLGALTIRLFYRYSYKFANTETNKGKFLNFLLRVVGGIKEEEKIDYNKKIKVAIIGAGRIGANLSEELLNNSKSNYYPVCFVDTNNSKVGRSIYSIPVLLEDDNIFEKLKKLEVQEVIFAISSMTVDKKQKLYSKYKEAGYSLKTYDYPIMQTPGSKRQLREIDIEELLFRKQINVIDERTKNYYKDKVILITGGGGSIGSELCRQLATMNPKQIVILDIYENGVYNVQQELKFLYGNKIDLCVEITSINNTRGMERVFKKYKPEIVINAAAHKHVPLMEHNCIEAIENNVFGTKVILDMCKKYKCGRFMMVSTDKAVNPTNVMGATKRMCEMITLSTGANSSVKCSATRFGNVLGSAGSVIPLFKKQIANGGPITITDKRIIRYFMTIKEASQLVLQSGALANNGELFVLDMGEPVRILDLAKNMIRLSGAEDIEIIETGLRPGEKLYEELLVKTNDLEKTDNDLIFIEKDKPLSTKTIKNKLKILKEACNTEDDEKARKALKKVIPNYKSPEEINKNAENKISKYNKTKSNKK